MNATLSLIKRELREHWQGPAMFYFSSVFLVIAGMLFANYIGIYRNNPGDGFENSVVAPFLGNINFIFLFVAPLFSIRALGQERGQGTLKIMMLSPLKAWQFLSAKFIAMWLSCLFIIVATLLVMMPGLIFFPISLAHLFSGYFGITLCVGCYLAVGMFSAILIESPLLAALTGFALLLGMMLLIAMAQAVDHYYLSQLLRHLSVPLHFEYFLRGLISSSDLVYLFSFMFVFLYASREVLQVRENW